jgi:hypothetical protein
MTVTRSDCSDELLKVARQEFEQWLPSAWFEADAQYRALLHNVATDRAAARRFVAAFTHDVAGIAALAGFTSLGSLALAVASEGRKTDWAVPSHETARLHRLWLALSEAIANRAEPDALAVHDWLHATVVDNSA